MALNNRLYKLFESVLWKKKTKNNTIGSIKAKTVFILSAGRTGTQFFYGFFNTCFKDVFAVHEPYPDLFDIGMQKLNNKWSSNTISEKIKEYRKPLLEKNLSSETSTYIESNPHAAYVIPELTYSFESIKFLYLVRNPIDSVRSFYAKSPLNNEGSMLFYGENDHRKRICPMDFPTDKWAKKWPGFSRVHKIAWFWNKVNSIILDSLQNTGNTILVKYEDFFSENPVTRESTLLEIVNFLDLTENRMADWDKINREMAQKSNATKTDYLPPFEQWPLKEKEMFMELTEVMRARLGYK